MDLPRTIDVVVSYLLVGVLSAGAMYFYLLRSAVAKAMRAEVAKRYGTRKMRQALGMPHPDIPKPIALMSPRFARIYEQAAYAEQDGYDEVCGVAYGKALEVLIKDYATSLRPAEAANIKMTSLADCISKHIDDESIRTSTDLARWLRNDQTHYEQSFTEHGVAELRKLIGITMLLVEQAEMKRATDARLSALRQSMDKDRSAKKSGA
jgi:hypothetical protein